VKYYDLLERIRANRLESTRRSFQTSSQWEATKRSVGLSTARVVDSHSDRYQRQWMATARHLICVNVRRMSLDCRDRNGDRHRDTSTTIEVIWRQKSTTKLWARSAPCTRSLAKLSSSVLRYVPSNGRSPLPPLATFSVTEPASWL